MNCPIRIVHIEDGFARKAFEPVFANGFARPNTLFESRPDFSVLRNELTTGNLASVYILDNEIVGDSEGKQGGEFATEIIRRSMELQRPTLVATLLCSNPLGVRQMYGAELDECKIPTFSKSSQAPICGFWTARCIDEDRIIPIDEYLALEGINLPSEELTAWSVQKEVMDTIKNASPGSFYFHPREFVYAHEQELSTWLKPEERQELQRIFPPLISRIER